MTDADASKAENLENIVPEARPLCAVLEVDIGETCPLTRIQDPIQEITVQHISEVCKVDAVVVDDTVRVVHIERDIHDGCLGSVFHDYDCVPNITAVDNETLTIAIYPPARSILRDLISDLRTVANSVKVTRLISLSDREDDETLVLCDLDILTEKEREALRQAVSQDYYEDSSDTKLQDIATDLDISPSALSHRLQSAEAKLVKDLISRRPASE